MLAQRFFDLVNHVFKMIALLDRFFAFFIFCFVFLRFAYQAFNFILGQA